MRNGKGDHFTKVLRRKIQEKKRLAANEVGLDQLVHQIVENELNAILIEYIKWKGFDASVFDEPDEKP
jgi:hypothetical protein